MKNPTFTLMALASMSLAPLFGQADQAGQNRGLPLRPSHASLANRVAEGKNPLATHQDIKPLTEDELQKKERRKLGGIVARSRILAHGGFWTMVPKGAVLHVPPTYRDRLVSEPSGKLLNWKQFYGRNRGWLLAQPVELSNARGETPLPESVTENHQRLGRVVIAVLHHGPISVKSSGQPKLNGPSS